jgi:hypothetical protein
MTIRRMTWAPRPSWSHGHRWIECGYGDLIARRLVCLGLPCARHAPGEVGEEVFLDPATRRIVGLGHTRLTHRESEHSTVVAGR